MNWENVRRAFCEAYSYWVWSFDQGADIRDEAWSTYVRAREEWLAVPIIRA